tara:strand:+ start:1686 stop:2516 length:831 start_codon:yes stop_codon:yes gene_type:complete
MLFKIKSKTFLPKEFPLIVGVLNLTPDSFYDGGMYKTRDQVLKRVEKMVLEGADIIDIGAESTRPFSKRISASNELKRLLPHLRMIKKNFDIPLSVDTMKSQVAEVSLGEGAEIINDVTGFLFDKDIPKVVGKHNGAIIINHTSSLPDVMQENTSYNDIVSDIKAFFKVKIKTCIKSGINKNSIVLDPGIGFGKKTNQNIDLIKNIEKFKSLGCPLMYGVSNKAFIGEVLKIKNPKRRTNGSVVAAYVCIENGAQLIRVHDVKETKQMVTMWRELN